MSQSSRVLRGFFMFVFLLLYIIVIIYIYIRNYMHRPAYSKIMVYHYIIIFYIKFKIDICTRRALFDWLITFGGGVACCCDRCRWKERVVSFQMRFLTFWGVLGAEL